MDLISEMYETLFKEGVPNVVIAGQKSDGIKTRLDTVAFGDNIFNFCTLQDEILISNCEGYRIITR